MRLFRKTLIPHPVPLPHGRGDLCLVRRAYCPARYVRPVGMRGSRAGGRGLPSARVIRPDMRRHAEAPESVTSAAGRRRQERASRLGAAGLSAAVRRTRLFTIVPRRIST